MLEIYTINGKRINANVEVDSNNFEKIMNSSIKYPLKIHCKIKFNSYYDIMLFYESYMLLIKTRLFEIKTYVGDRSQLNLKNKTVEIDIMEY